MRLVPACLLLLAACAPTESEPAGWIAPFDGQTDFDPEQDLVLSMTGITIPDDYPVPELIQVMDLLDGGRVPGTVTHSGGELRFAPDFPWEADRRCAWTIYDPFEIPHGPEVRIPDELEGTYTFEVSDNIHALEATLGENEGQVCLLLSRPVDAPLLLTVWDEEVETQLVADDPPESLADFPIPETDGGPGARCFDPPTDVAVGDALRIRIEGADVLFAQGPWRLVLSDQPLSTLLAGRRQTTTIPEQWETP